MGAGPFGLDWLAPLFPFQVAGIERLIGDAGVLLGDEMGLGKTIQAIGALRILRSRDLIGSAIVITPAGLVLQWRRQMRLWAPELRPSTVIGGSDERRRAWHTKADVHIVSYETLKADAIAAGGGPLQKRRWDVVVLDEAQRIKTADSETARVVKRLDRGRSWALTGTPLENRLDDLISILDFVVPGRFQARGDGSRIAAGFVRSPASPPSL